MRFLETVARLLGCSVEKAEQALRNDETNVKRVLNRRGASPPGKELAYKWKDEGARIFRITGSVPDEPMPDTTAEGERILESGPCPATITEF